MSATESSLRFLRLHDVERLTSLKRAAIYARMSRGQFPTSVQISSRCTVWVESEVVEWMAALPRGVGPRPGTPTTSRVA
jgi:prophage regulatory protein